MPLIINEKIITNTSRGLKHMKVLINNFDFVSEAIKKYLPDYEFHSIFTKSRWKYNYILDYFELRKLFRKGVFEEYDVIHINNWTNFLLIKYKLPHQVWIAESHGSHPGLDLGEGLAYTNKIISWLLYVPILLTHYFVRRSIKKFDIYFVAIPNILDKAKNIREDATWLPNPISDDFFNSTPKLKFEHYPAIFFPSRLHPMKMPEIGFEIFDKILKKYPDAKLHLIRYPDYANNNNQYKDYLIKYSSNIVWHNFYSRSELPDVYCSFDLILGAFLVKNDRLNLVELEAMASGGVVLSYDTREFMKTKISDFPNRAISLIENKKMRIQYIKDSREYVNRVHSAKSIACMYSSKVENAKSSRTFQ